MSRIFKLKLHKKDDVQNVIDVLTNIDGVLFAEKNGGAEPTITTPDDTYFGYQWGLKNGTTGRDIHAIQAWDIYKGTSNNIIAIIDGGIDKTHPDLIDKVSGDDGYGWGGHGMHVAGIAAAISNNNNGISGVDWYAKLHAQRIDNTDDVGTYNAIVDAVNYSSSVHVLNNSWTLINSDYSPRYSTTVRLAFAYTYKNNRNSVVAMGNDNNSVTQYPAGFGQGIIAVGATDQNDNRSIWLYGQGSSYGNHIDVAAPGSDILSTYRNGNFAIDPNYHSAGGTSMAAPHVAGIASLLKGYKPTLDNDDIENLIQLSADEVAGMGGQDFTIEYGYGRVNARKALNYLRAPYVLEHNSASGGSVYSSTGTYTTVFYGVSGLADGVYIVKRYEVRKTVNLNGSLLDKQIWGRGVNTVGFSAASPNYGMGWCDVVSTSSTSATLRTYVYYVYSILGQSIGYYPTSPSNVQFEYTVLGYTLPTPTISMSGGIGDNPTLTFSYNENIVDHFVLKKEYDFGSGFNASYVNPASNPYTDSNVEITRFGGDLVARYSVKVVDAFGNESSYSNTVSTNGQSLWKENIEQNENEVIKEYSLESNYPNPFNPSTKIDYQIPKDSFVNLIVYNTLGQKVAVLVNKHQTSGKYSVQFDASNLPSGVYIYKLQAGEFSSVKKMLLTK